MTFMTVATRIVWSST